jgi:hypothetical protein
MNSPHPTDSTAMLAGNGLQPVLIASPGRIRPGLVPALARGISGLKKEGGPKAANPTHGEKIVGRNHFYLTDYCGQ